MLPAGGEFVDASLVLYRSDLAQVAVTCAALAAQEPPVRTVRVHVNAATADELSAVEAVVMLYQGEWLVSWSTENRGFCAAHNAALAASFAAGAAAVLVLNPDVALDRGSLATLVEFATAQQEPALVGPLLELAREDMVGTGLVDSAGIQWNRWGRHVDALQGTPLRDTSSEPTEVAGLTGACLVVPRSTYELIVRASGEFFDEHFVAYREDAELALRCQRLGVGCWLVPAGQVRHARRLQGSSRDVSPHINRLGVQNRFLIRFKHGRRRPGVWPLPAVRDLQVLLAVVLRERSSWSGVVRAARLRRLMRNKRRRLESASS